MSLSRPHCPSNASRFRRFLPWGAWSGGAGVASPCSQVELVGVVREHQQGVEVPAPFQDAMLAPPPTHRAVHEAVNRQGRPGCRGGPLQVRPAGQVRLSGWGQTRTGPEAADLMCCTSLRTSWGSSRPLMDTLRARLAVVFGSGQAKEDRKLGGGASLKQRGGKERSTDGEHGHDHPHLPTAASTAASTAPSHSRTA